MSQSKKKENCRPEKFLNSTSAYFPNAFIIMQMLLSARTDPAGS